MADEMHAGRISVSREALRAELAEMELRMTRWVASADSVKSVEARVSALEASKIAREEIPARILTLEHAVEKLESDSIGEQALHDYRIGLRNRVFGTGVGVVLAVTGLNLAIYFFGG